VHLSFLFTALHDYMLFSGSVLSLFNPTFHHNLCSQLRSPYIYSRLRSRPHRTSSRIKRFFAIKVPTRAHISINPSIAINKETEKRTTYHPRSAPPLKNPQSPFATQSHPPPTPRPFLHTGADGDARINLVPSASGLSSQLPFLSPPSSLPVEEEEPPLLLNVLNPAVKTLKSSSELSSGIRPVKARPMAINGAACAQIRIDLLVLWDGAISASNKEISASTSAIIPSKAVATRLCSWVIVSPRREGIRRGL
jgi:hypothetical protein